MGAPEHTSGDGGERLPQLPPGRHGLPREYVARNQRDRLTAGIIAAVVEHGFHEASITAIAAAAGVSRRTFYSYYSSKEECFAAAYEAVADHLLQAMAERGEDEEDWPRRVRVELSALLEALAANPDLVRFCLVAPPAAGGEIAPLYEGLLSRLGEELTVGMPTPPQTRELGEVAERSLLGGLAGLLVAKVNAGEGERLAELLPDLHELVLSAYLGREIAVREARRP